MRPLVPVRDVQVGPAESRVMDANEHVGRPILGLTNLGKHQSWSCSRFGYRAHCVLRKGVYRVNFKSLQLLVLARSGRR